MKPHPRIRKTVKWGGAVVTVLLVVVWIGSRLGYFVLLSPGGTGVICSGGGFALCYASNAKPLGTELFSRAEWGHTGHVNQWWFESGRIGRGWAVTIPGWFPFALLLVLVTSAWRLDTLARRRARIGRCPKCNYDRTGLAPGAVCPECGSAPA